MPLTEDEKEYIANKVVEILRAPDKAERIEALRKQVLEGPPEAEGGASVTLDDAVYAVLEAIEELYG